MSPACRPRCRSVLRLDELVTRYACCIAGLYPYPAAGAQLHMWCWCRLLSSREDLRPAGNPLPVSQLIAGAIIRLPEAKNVPSDTGCAAHADIEIVIVRGGSCPRRSCGLIIRLPTCMSGSEPVVAVSRCVPSSEHGWLPSAGPRGGPTATVLSHRFRFAMLSPLIGQRGDNHTTVPFDDRHHVIDAAVRAHRAAPSWPSAPPHADAEGHPFLQYLGDRESRFNPPAPREIVIGQYDRIEITCRAWREIGKSPPCPGLKL